MRFFSLVGPWAQQLDKHMLEWEEGIACPSTNLYVILNKFKPKVILPKNTKNLLSKTQFSWIYHPTQLHSLGKMYNPSSILPFTGIQEYNNQGVTVSVQQ